ncbi:MAG: CHAT domain-containing protein [Candidatus Hodarchaeota archaeon]
MNDGLILSIIMDYINDNDLKVIDDFPIFVKNILCSYMEKNKTRPKYEELIIEVDKIKTSFFKINNEITKKKFINDIINLIPNTKLLDIEEEKKEDKIHILFLASNPQGTNQLKLDQEMRSIDRAIRTGNLREKIIVNQQWAVRVSELQEHLLRYKPNIVHFSGHGSPNNEIILEDDAGRSHIVSVKALSELFRILKDSIRCVVLNACYTETQAQAIAQYIDCVIGMSNEIGDEAAIMFSSSFYRALAYGSNVKTAFDLAINQIDLSNLGDQDIPKLIALNQPPEEIIFF